METRRTRLVWPVVLAALMLLAGFAGTTRTPESVLRSVSGLDHDRADHRNGAPDRGSRPG
ncbi:hypothetical protein [Spirillospora sp. NPDC029432]|uniref:hypothetical protein n=1 Tax=Spirillospora sp. NPDC029432 TaxID=3154599 RepID=UPI003453023C